MMKTRTKLIALVGVAAAGAYVASKIKRTQDIKPSISVELPESQTVFPKVASKSTLSKSLTQSYSTQIAEMAKTLDPKKKITLVQYIATDETKGPEVEVLLIANGYEKVVGSARMMFKKKVKADAQTILDAVIFTAEIAKTHKLKYLGWDFSE
jgi:hypothetical protein